MTQDKKKKLILSLVVFVFILAGGLVFFAFARTWGKTDIEVSFRINEELVRQSVYGESPTIAIWIEDAGTGTTQTIFVTNRAGMEDWEGKAEVPSALPKWFEISQNEPQIHNSHENEIPLTDAVTGATPKPGYFSTRVKVEPGSTWYCWIEVNLAGDYNDYYQEYDRENKMTDEYGTGQPALVYKAKIKAVEGNSVVPEIVGMSVIDSNDGKIIQPLEGITTAKYILEEIKIEVVKPKPRII